MGGDEGGVMEPPSEVGEDRGMDLAKNLSWDCPVFSICYASILSQSLNLTALLNFHRPCFFPDEVVDHKGRVTKRYRYQHLMTPYEKLKSLDNADRFLKPNITFQDLDEIALKQSDNDAARQLNLARQELFQSIQASQYHAA